MIPDGMRDILPPWSLYRRILEERSRRRFSAYGYEEVITPWFEYDETLVTAHDDTLSAGYRVWDEQGRQIVARTDLTVPVARLATTRYDDEPLPLRFSYVGPALRSWAPQRGPDGEFVQAGIELLGLSGPAADAEAVSLLCDALGACGLREFRVMLGTVAFSRGLVASLALDADDSGKLLKALSERDYPLLESIARKSHLGDSGRKALQRSLDLAGTRDSLAQARKLVSTSEMEDALERLIETHDLVAEAGYGQHLGFDLGLYQEITYYSDLVFEVYAGGSALPIAAGGRYDGLLERFDWDIPAVGFAIVLDRLEEALEEAEALPELPPPALSFVGGLERPERAAELRRLGWDVIALPAGAESRPRPSLVRSGSGYELRLEGGNEVVGSWREVMAALTRVVASP